MWPGYNHRTAVVVAGAGGSRGHHSWAVGRTIEGRRQAEGGMIECEIVGAARRKMGFDEADPGLAEGGTG